MTLPGRSRAEIVEYLRAGVAAELRCAADTIDPERPLTYYGLDSLSAATIAGDLSDWLGRDLPDDLVLARVTVSSLADRLADPAFPLPARSSSAAGRASDRIDYAALDYARTPRGERLLKALVRALVRLTSRVSIDGQDTVPLEGPALLATNHLHILDAAWMASAMPRRTIFLVAEEFERKPIVGWLLNAGRVIYISRGKADREALDRALAVLNSGGALGVAPEGRLSRTGGLIQGQVGIAYLASQACVPVIPVVAWGQERAGHWWLRLRRVPVHIRFGRPVTLPQGLAGPRDLERGTDLVMRALARLLPPAYQGVYREPAGG
jgi:1-acyl-sn-glycerol-3-phosphate acyltransferase